jgi:hypothetical protein
MIRRSASCLGIDPAKPKLGQIEFVNKGTDHANRIGVPCINIPPTGFTSYAQERGGIAPYVRYAIIGLVIPQGAG